MKYSVGMKLKKVKHGNGGNVGGIFEIASVTSTFCKLSNELGVFTYDYLDANYVILPSSTILITTDGRTTTAQLKEGKQTVREAKAVCNPSDTFNLNTGASLALNRLLYGTDYHPSEVAFKPTVREVKRPAKVGEWIKVTYGENPNCYKYGEIAKVEAAGEENTVRAVSEVGNKFYITNGRYLVLENYEPPKEPEQPKYWSGKAICVSDGLLSDGVLTVGKVYAVKDGLMKQDNGLLAPYYESPITGIDDMNAKCARHSECKFIEYKGEQPAKE